MRLFQYRTLLQFRIFYRYTSSTRLQVFQHATQIVDPQRIRNVGIIAHIDAGNSLINKDDSFERTRGKTTDALILSRENDHS